MAKDKMDIREHITDFDRYQELMSEVAIYPGKGEFLGIVYCGLKVSGEAGEVSEKIGKIMRDQRSQILPENREDLKKELGDVLWYVARIAAELDIPLSEVAQANVDKLLDRKARGVLGGSGDNR